MTPYNAVFNLKMLLNGKLKLSRDTKKQLFFYLSNVNKVKQLMLKNMNAPGVFTIPFYSFFFLNLSSYTIRSYTRQSYTFCYLFVFSSFNYSHYIHRTSNLEFCFIYFFYVICFKYGYFSALLPQ